MGILKWSKTDITVSFGDELLTAEFSVTVLMKLGVESTNNARFMIDVYVLQRGKSGAQICA
jgi:hypothetical protein